LQGRGGGSIRPGKEGKRETAANGENDSWDVKSADSQRFRGCPAICNNLRGKKKKG